MYTFSQLLKRIRKESHLTQAEFAQALGVSKMLVAMIETKQREPSRGFVSKLADRLEVRPASIMPFSFPEDEVSLKKLSAIERQLVRTVERFQHYLISKKAKKLREYV